MWLLTATLSASSDALTLILTFLRTIYDFVRRFLDTLLSETIFKANSEMAALYSDAVTLLVTLTAFYLIFEFVLSAKKIVRFVLILGWILLLVSFAISAFR